MSAFIFVWITLNHVETIRFPNEAACQNAGQTISAKWPNNKNSWICIPEEAK